ncbi:hypothetical protein HG530_005694 [Fusarium avenaceum]|nr:hypothetical protein HG530_005694 [Fusarium avenaceum]
MEIPINADEITIVHFRPKAGTRYIIAPRRTPTMPGAKTPVVHDVRQPDQNSVIRLEGFKKIQGESALLLVHLGHVLKGVDGLGVFTTVDKKLWGLMEVEDEKPKNKDKQGDGANGEEEISPSHVVATTTAVCAGVGKFARLECIWFGEVGLNAQRRPKQCKLMPCTTEWDLQVEDLLNGKQAKSDHTNDICQKTPDKGSRRQSSIETGRDIPRLHQTEGLSPQQIKQVSEAAQRPDVPLVFAHALVVDLAVDQDAFLLVEGQAFEAVEEGVVGAMAMRVPQFRGRSWNRQGDVYRFA